MDAVVQMSSQELCETPGGSYRHLSIVAQILTTRPFRSAGDQDAPHDQIVAIEHGRSDSKHTGIHFAIGSAVAVTPDPGEMVLEALPVCSQPRFRDVAIMLLEDADQAMRRHIGKNDFGTRA